MHFQELNGCLSNMFLLRPFRLSNEQQLLRLHRIAALLALWLSLLLLHKQVVSLSVHQVPGAGSRAARAGYFWLSCPQDAPNQQHQITPLPDSRYFYSETYGWFDSSHFDAGNPAQLIDNVETAVAGGGGTITISQEVRDGITGYTATYHVSQYVPKEAINAAALGIYMDWSLRFEAWQAGLPRGLFGPLTPFSIEDLPTQYLGFFEDARHLNRAVLFTCYLDTVKTSDAPPHLWVTNPEDRSQLPRIKRLTNKTFEPLILTEAGWQHVSWPAALQLESIPSSSITWMFLSEETWYLNQVEP